MTVSPWAQILFYLALFTRDLGDTAMFTVMEYKSPALNS